MLTLLTLAVLTLTATAPIVVPAFTGQSGS
jgi:hypothetical protein